MKKSAKQRERDRSLSLKPLDFETALRAAMATGKMPKSKPTKKKKKKSR